MNFTREPIIETIITPREGCKLVVRSSKCSGQEEYYVDAIEIVSFGQALFFRSTERPKYFFVPVTDYEVIEARETRMVLKAAPTDKGIKIGGGRENSSKTSKGAAHEKEEEYEGEDFEGIAAQDAPDTAEVAETRTDKKRDRRKSKRRKTRVEEKEENRAQEPAEKVFDDMSESYQEEEKEKPKRVPLEEGISMQPFPALIPPPSTLISDTISMYKGNADYKKAFFDDAQEKSEEKSEDMPNPPTFHDD